MTKPPIVVLHGWNLSSSRFTPLTKLLKRKGYRVFCPDLPGFGSAAPLNRAWDLSDYCAFVSGFLEEHTLSGVVLVGHSFGGRIAIRLAAKDHQRISVLVLTGAPGISPVSFVKATFFLFLARVGNTFFSLPFLRSFRETAKRFLYRSANAMDYYTSYPRLQETFENVVRENLSGYLREIAVPTLLLWGREDCIVPVWIGKKMAHLLSRATYQEIRGARHGAPWTHADAFVSHIEQYLASHPTSF